MMRLDSNQSESNINKVSQKSFELNKENKDAKKTPFLQK
jgi:hypothetical protein